MQEDGGEAVLLELGDVVVGLLLRALVVRRLRIDRDRAFVERHAGDAREHVDRARVDEARDARGASGVRDDARPAGVHARERARIASHCSGRPAAW
jgi:hypothetical protein